MNVLLIGSLAQIVFSLPWYALGSIYDRYMLGFLPGFLILCASSPRTMVPIRLPRLYYWRWNIALPILLVFAVTGFAFAGEYFSCLHARAALYRSLLAEGVKPEQIDAGFELCGETQIAQTGYINNKRMHIPDGKYVLIPTGDCPTDPVAFPAIDTESFSPRVPRLLIYP